MIRIFPCCVLALACHAGGGATVPPGDAQSCPFPTSFAWSSTGPLAEPQGLTRVSLKDFTIAKANDAFVVYGTVFDKQLGWVGVNFNFRDWSALATAPQAIIAGGSLGSTTAPTLLYFTPKRVWVLAYQAPFQYATSTNPAEPSTWSLPQALLKDQPPPALDQALICDATDCFLFFAGDNGKIYRSQMPIAEFPSTFVGYQTILTDTQVNLYESVQVYSVKGTGQYLMLVEAVGAVGRYFRAFSAPNLRGTFTPLPGASTEQQPFAGHSNVTFAGPAWTKDVSHGDFVRLDPSETLPVDPCHLEFLYQGFDRTAPLTDYATIPWRPALLTRID